MPKTKQTPQIVTRLARADLLRFEDLVRRRGQNKTQVAREAILWYLNNEDSLAQADLASQIIAEIKKQTNRECAMLAKVGIDIHTLVRYFYEILPDDHTELWEQCMDKAVHRMKRKITPEETIVRDSLAADA